MARPQLALGLSGARAGGGLYVLWVAGKRLVAVDLPHLDSNQHELNGSKQLREAFGPERVEGRIRWLSLSDDEGVIAESDGRFTWYDARETHPTRSEYRLYYDAGTLLSEATPGDLLILVSVAAARGQGLVGFVIPGGSTLETQLCWLFGLDPERLDQFTVPDASVLAERSGHVESFEILETLGLVRSGVKPPATDLDLVRRRFGDTFPSSAEMSEFARDEAPADAESDPDTALLLWLEREEQLFRALEEFIVAQKLDEGFEGVDDFIAFSLSVQNRRKARMGLALENHLKAVFDACEVSYSHQPVTENRARPDFLFPSIEAYRDPSFPDDALRMLAAKSTCKDRWRQVLSEAARIDEKHLCTLEPGISVAQTDQMKAHRVRLVVPSRVHATYAPKQRSWLVRIAGFVRSVS